MTIEVRITNREDEGGRALYVRDRHNAAPEQTPRAEAKYRIGPGESQTFHVHAAKALVVYENPEGE